MKAHIGVDVDSGLVHTVRGTASNVNDVLEADSLLHEHGERRVRDAGYQGAEKRPDAKAGVNWRIAMRRGKRRGLDKADKMDALVDRFEKLKASVRAKVEHSFRAMQGNTAGSRNGSLSEQDRNESSGLGRLCKGPTGQLFIPIGLAGLPLGQTLRALSPH